MGNASNKPQPSSPQANHPRAPGNSERDKESEFYGDRHKLVRFFMGVIGAVLAFGAITIVAMVVIVFSNWGPAEKRLLIEVMQIGLGMIFGFASVSFGVVITWVGITSPSTIAVGDSGQKDTGVVPRITLRTAAPGLVLFLGGLVLVGVSLYKPVSSYKHSEVGSQDMVQPERGP
jgi:hypothetical protein